MEDGSDKENVSCGQANECRLVWFKNYGRLVIVGMRTASLPCPLTLHLGDGTFSVGNQPLVANCVLFANDAALMTSAYRSGRRCHSTSSGSFSLPSKTNRLNCEPARDMDDVFGLFLHFQGAARQQKAFIRQQIRSLNDHLKRLGTERKAAEEPNVRFEALQVNLTKTQTIEQQAEKF
jgi:hypothetical protein